MKPLVSIIVPTFNREKTIKYCLDSLINQTYENIEIIVVDDGSNDNTVEIVKSYKDHRIKCIIMPVNKGAQVARNLGIKNSNGELIAFQDSDDEWVKDKLKIQLEVMEQNKADIVYSDCLVRTIDESLKPMGIERLEGDIYKQLLMKPGPMFQSLLLKKECLTDIGFLDENVVAYQEWDTVIRLAKKYCFTFINNELFIYHLHSGSTISKNLLKGYEGYFYIVRKFENEIFGAYGVIGLYQHYKFLLNGFAEEKEAQLKLKNWFSKYLPYESKKITNSRRICIFGASESGKECLNILQNNKIFYFIDNQNSNKIFHGYAVYPVEKVLNDDIDLIILASNGRTLQMREQLNLLGIGDGKILDFKILKEIRGEQYD